MRHRRQHRRVPFVALPLLVLVGSCQEPGVKECPSGLVCLVDQVCHRYDTRYETTVKDRCIQRGRYEACRKDGLTLEDGASCSFHGKQMRCRDGICDEWRCGDQITDVSLGEECDNGGGNYDGCSINCKKERFLWIKAAFDAQEPSPPPISGGVMVPFQTSWMANQPYGSIRTCLMGGRTDKGVLEDNIWCPQVSWLNPLEGRWLKFPWSGPPPRAGHAAATFGTGWRETVVHGGQGTGLLQDTWLTTFNMKWKKVEGGPGKRIGHTMVWETSRKRLLMFGGASRGSSPYLPHGDLWTFDASMAWQKVKGKQADPSRAWKEIEGKHPPARLDHVMIVDPIRKRTILSGGITDHALDDRADCQVKSHSRKSCLLMTGWILDGVKWRPMSGPQVSPGRRSAAGAYYLGKRGPMIFGGITTDGSGKPRVLDDLWLGTADGEGWRQIKKSPSAVWPAARHGHAMISVGSVVMMYGGQGKNGETLGDLWFGLYH